MSAQIEFRRMKEGDERQVFTFISKVFHQFVATEFSQEGIEEFMTYVQPDALVNHLKRNHFGLIATVRSEIIGVIIVRDHTHVALFFVDAHYQRRGVGRELVRIAVEHCRLHDATIKQVTVNASPNSIDAYKKFNFEPTDVKQCVNGIPFIPMVLRLQHPGNG